MRCVGKLKRRANWKIEIQYLPGSEIHIDSCDLEDFWFVHNFFEPTDYEWTTTEAEYRRWPRYGEMTKTEIFKIHTIPVLFCPLRLMSYNSTASNVDFVWQAAYQAKHEHEKDEEIRISSSINECFDVIRKIISGEIMSRDGWVRLHIAPMKRGQKLTFHFVDPDEWEPI